MSNLNLIIWLYQELLILGGINIIKSNAEIIKKQRIVLLEYGFVFNSDDVENGVPVERYVR